MRKIHRVTAVVAMAAAGALLAGCGSGSSSPGSSGSSQGGGSSASGGSATPTQAALLTAADLPSGLQIKTLDVNQAMQQGSALAGMNMQVDPPECGSIMSAALGRASTFQGVGMMATTSNATDPSQIGAITELVLKKTPALDIDTLRTNLQKCGNATVTMGSMKATSSTQEIPLTGVHADQEIGISQQTKVSGLPTSVPGMSNQMAFMVTGDEVVAVTLTGSPGGITLTNLAGKALQKVQSS